MTSLHCEVRGGFFFSVASGKFQKGWIDEEIDGTDLTNTAYKADPGFFDVIGGDFSIATISPQALDSETDIRHQQKNHISPMILK